MREDCWWDSRGLLPDSRNCRIEELGRMFETFFCWIDGKTKATTYFDKTIFFLSNKVSRFGWKFDRHASLWLSLSLSSCHSATLVGTASGSLLLSLLSPSFSTTLVVSNFSLFSSNLTSFNLSSLIRWRFVTVSRSDLFFLLVFVQESAGERESKREGRVGALLIYVFLLLFLAAFLFRLRCSWESKDAPIADSR